MKLPPELICLEHSLPLMANNGAIKNSSTLTCPRGCGVPVVKGIPRFVDSANYASAFGLQWNTFRKTQLDSYTGTTISRDRLSRCLGGSLDIVHGKTVLEVGCGAGRFTELILAAGARVFACDLSNAVEANYENLGDSPNYFVCQADLRHLPVQPHLFDFVLCLGVIQHTPSPEETIGALARYVKPGGMLVVDHYTYGTAKNQMQKRLRRFLLRLSPRLAKSISVTLSRALLLLHKISWSEKRGRWRLRGPLQKYSPLADYHAAYPQLGTKLLGEWALLDTHDMVTDIYKHERNVEEITNCLAGCGLTELEVYYAGNGVEARARMPVGNSRG